MTSRPSGGVGRSPKQPGDGSLERFGDVSSKAAYADVRPKSPVCGSRTYVVLVQVLNGGYSNQCCWTNAYVNVTVTP